MDPESGSVEFNGFEDPFKTPDIEYRAESDGYSLVKYAVDLFELLFFLAFVCHWCTPSESH